MEDFVIEPVVRQPREDSVDGSETEDGSLTCEEARALRLTMAAARSQELGLPELEGGSLRMRQGMVLARDRLYAEYERWERSAWRSALSDRQWAFVERLVNRIFHTTEARWFLRRGHLTLLELLSEQLWGELQEEKQRIEAGDAPDAETPAPPSGEESVTTAGDDGVAATG